MKLCILKASAVLSLLCTVAQAAPMVTISKNCPNLRYLGRNAVFEINVTNQGDAPAFDVVVRDEIAGGVQYVGADNGGTREGNLVVWRLGRLDAGQSRVLTVTVRCDQIGRVRNRATVSYCAEAAAECELEVKGIPAILLECVDDPDPIELNGTVTYTITVTNQGTAMGTNIRIKCTLPTEETYQGSSGPTGEGVVAGQDISFPPVPSLSPNAKAVFKVTAGGAAVGDVRFKVEMNTDQIDTPVMETESTRIYN